MYIPPSIPIESTKVIGPPVEPQTTLSTSTTAIEVSSTTSKTASCFSTTTLLPSISFDELEVRMAHCNLLRHRSPSTSHSNNVSPVSQLAEGTCFRSVDEMPGEFNFFFYRILSRHEEIVQTLKGQKTALKNESDLCDALKMANDADSPADAATFLRLVNEKKHNLHMIDQKLKGLIAEWNDLTETFIEILQKWFSEHPERATFKKLCGTLFGLQDHILSQAPALFWIVPSRHVLKEGALKSRLIPQMQKPANTQAIDFVLFATQFEPQLAIREHHYSGTSAQIAQRRMAASCRENMNTVLSFFAEKYLEKDSPTTSRGKKQPKNPLEREIQKKAKKDPEKRVSPKRKETPPEEEKEGSPSKKLK